MYRINGTVTLSDGEKVELNGNGKTVLEAAINLAKQMCRYNGEVDVELAYKTA